MYNIQTRQHARNGLRHVVLNFYVYYLNNSSDFISSHFSNSKLLRILSKLKLVTEAQNIDKILNFYVYYLNEVLVNRLSHYLEF